MRIDTTKHQYAHDSLHQSYELYIPELSDSSLDTTRPRYWLLYLHGGYYRDPTVTSSSFRPALRTLLTSPSYVDVRESVVGYAMINYRLSPHPDHPQNPATIPAYEMRTARHPEHINDVLTAIGALQRSYGFGERYILVGHSVGATLALQVALSRATPWQPTQEDTNRHESVLPPTAIIGVSGIYDFPLIHRTNPSYLDLTGNAFGESVETYRLASPACHDLTTYERQWSSGGQGTKRVAILAHSHGDGLVPWGQVEAMARVFGDNTKGDPFDFQVLEIEGKHDQIWKEGGEMARVVGVSVDAVRALDETSTTDEHFSEKNVKEHMCKTSEFVY